MISREMEMAVLSDAAANERDHRGSSYDDNQYQFLTVGYGVTVLNQIVAAWREKHPLLTPEPPQAPAAETTEATTETTGQGEQAEG